MKKQYTSTKLQTNFKFQYPTRDASACAARDPNGFEMFVSGGFVRILNFGHCDLFGI
jgi:hypothetical protein